MLSYHNIKLIKFYRFGNMVGTSYINIYITYWFLQLVIIITHYRNTVIHETRQYTSITVLVV
jgi:hypothetical protein